MKKKLPPSEKQLKAILNQSSFNPRVVSPFSIILETSGNNPEFLVVRAVEMLQEFRQTKDEDKIIAAISLLGMARLNFTKSVKENTNGKKEQIQASDPARP